MTKIKPIMPALREKKRYVMFEVISDNRFHGCEPIARAVDSSFLGLWGEMGAADAGLVHLNDKFSADKQTGIVKVSHKSVGKFKSSLALIRKIDGHDVIVRSVDVSGILKKIQKRAS